MSKVTEEIFLSGTRETQSRTNLFRPRELREVVFPGLGMIMHSLFWVKHSFYLGEAGYELGEQDSILLWAEGDGAVYAESLVYYCVYSNMESAGGVTVNAGQRATRDWLFRRDAEREGGVYAQVAANLRSLAETPDAPDYERFIEATFASWFRTRCDEHHVELEAELREAVGSALTVSDPGEREVALARGFATAVGRVVREHPVLRSGKNLQVISTTSDFAQRVYRVASPEDRRTLANTELRFTAAEASALLASVSRMENGEHFLRSLVFLLYLDPVAHSREEVEQEMRHLYDLVVADPESIVGEVQAKYQLSVIDEQVTDGIEATAFYWVLNFFMADGETLARGFLDEAASPTDVDAVRDYFDEHPARAEKFRSFFEYTAECRPYLSALVSELGSGGDSSTRRFVDTLMDGLANEREPAVLFIKLLESQATLEEKSEGTYLVERRPTNTNAATFYGIGPLLSWAETIVDSLQS